MTEGEFIFNVLRDSLAMFGAVWLVVLIWGAVSEWIRQRRENKSYKPNKEE